MENEFDTTENTIKFFDRFFAYDLLDRYPNHRIATEADYSLRLLWSAEKVCIQDWSFSGERIRKILYEELTIEILLNAIGAYKIYCTTPWDLSIIILAMVRSVHMLLHEAMDSAVREGLVPCNPTKGATIPKNEHPRTLASILGHTKASFTLDTSTHITTDMQKNAAGIVGNYITDIFGKELKPWQSEENPAKV